MTMTESRPTTVTATAAMVDVSIAKAAIAAAASGNGGTHPTLECVAFTVNGEQPDRWDVQATESHVALWTGAAPSEKGHFLVNGKALAAALRATNSKGGLVLISFEGDTCTVFGRDSTVTLQRFEGPAFPRLALLVPTASGEVEHMGLTAAVMGIVNTVAKLLGEPAAYKLTFQTALKPVAVSFPNNPDVHMLVMPYRVS